MTGLQGLGALWLRGWLLCYWEPGRGFQEAGPCEGARVNNYRSWDWAASSEETAVFVMLRALPPFGKEGAGILGGVCVPSELGGEKGLLALRGWI